MVYRISDSKLFFVFSVAIGMMFLLSSSYLDLVNATSDNQSGASDVIYIAKFVCGTIEDRYGPLRPGHYDTDVGVFNKQVNDATFFWNASVNNGVISHSTLISLKNQGSTSINCQDIKKVTNLDSEIMIEGFVTITIPQNYNPAQPNLLTTYQANADILDVQAFYTANALDTLPHEIIMEKISFYIIEDKTGKIPDNLIKTILDVTLQSEINKISSTEEKVKNIIAQSYDIHEDEIILIQIRIKDVSIGVGSMIDDHAISLNILEPQPSSTNSR